MSNLCFSGRRGIKAWPFLRWRGMGRCGAGRSVKAPRSKGVAVLALLCWGWGGAGRGRGFAVASLYWAIISITTMGYGSPPIHHHRHRLLRPELSGRHRNIASEFTAPWPPLLPQPISTQPSLHAWPLEGGGWAGEWARTPTKTIRAQRDPSARSTRPSSRRACARPSQARPACARILCGTPAHAPYLGTVQGRWV